jgi:hypothetical protein
MARVLELGADINEGDDMLKTGFPTYGTPLLRAIKTGETEAVRFLLERGRKCNKARVRWADVAGGGEDWSVVVVVVLVVCMGMR